MPESSGSFVDTSVVSLDQESDGVRFYTVETCHEDHVPCSLSDANAVYLIEGNRLRIAHLGDPGHVLTETQAAAIATVDVLLIPVGGGPRIDALRANRVIEQLQPLVILAMHYETPELDWNIDTFLVDETVIEVAERSLVINAAPLPEELTVFVLSYQ